MSDIKPLVEAGTREQRAVTLDHVEFRTDDDSGVLKFRGHAAVFDEWTEIPSIFGGSFLERVQRGAFRRPLNDGADVRFLINHQGLPLARTASGTMRLKEDSRGLLVDAELAPTQEGRDLAILLERRDISQMSFGFTVGRHELEEDEENGTVRRTITEFSNLYDVSPVTFPAYEGTDAAMRAQKAAADFAEAIKALKEANDAVSVRSLLPKTSGPQDRFTAQRAHIVLAELQQ